MLIPQEAKNNTIKTEAGENKLLENAENLYQSMRITVDARFQAGKKLESLDNYTFVTTIIISLALIFIPLLQFSDIKLHYSDKVLSALQTFFAVAVLVYSVVISTAKYSSRAKEMTKCADLIKDLSREFKDIIAINKTKNVDNDEKITKDLLRDFNIRYRECLRNSENHSDGDYYFVKKTLHLKDQEKTELKWWRKSILHRVIRIWLKIKCCGQYILPTVMMFFVFVVILDIIGITSLISPFITKNAD